MGFEASLVEFEEAIEGQLLEKSCDWWFASVFRCLSLKTWMCDDGKLDDWTCGEVYRSIE